MEGAFVIVGSRSSEEWLKAGTFQSNQYLLQGLDRESANSFALSILKEAGIADGTVRVIVKEAEFERLMKLLAGYPLALKAILPNLKQKTIKRILEELQQGMGDLDKGNLQEKTESIIKCIEYAHSNLSAEAQQLLLCLAPFQSVVNLQPSVIGIYFDELRKEEIFQHYPFEKLETVVQEAVQNGFMQRAEPSSSMQLMSLQPVFTFFLKNRLAAENSFLQQHLQAAYVSYYRELSKLFNEYMSSNDPQGAADRHFYVEQEYENLYEVLSISLDMQRSIRDVYEVMDTYLDKHQLSDKRLELAEKVHARLQDYPAESLEAGVGVELAFVKNTLANIYQDLKRYDSASQTYQQLLSFIDLHPSFFDNLEYAKAPVYHNLGIVSRNQKDYAAAREYCLKALDMYVQFKNVHRQGRVYQSLGIVSWEQKDYVAAREYYLKALDAYVQFKDVHKQGVIYLNLGNVSRDQRDYAAAKEYYLKALDAYVQFKDVYSQGEVYTNLGTIYWRQKDYGAAREYYLKGLDVFVQFKDVYKQGEIYQNLGNVSRDQRDYAAAREYYLKALDVYVQFEDVYRQGDIYQNLGNVSWDQKDYAAAKEYYLKALDAYVQFQGCV